MCLDSPGEDDVPVIGRGAAEGRLGAGPPGTSNPSHGEASGEAHAWGGQPVPGSCQSPAAGPVETERVRNTGARAVGRVQVLGQGLS